MVTPLRNPVHITLWEAALEHHHVNNPHHPEHSPGHSMSYYNLLESLLDVIATRLSNIAGSRGYTPGDIFDVPDTLVAGYTQKDREKVSSYLTAWSISITFTPHRHSLAKKLVDVRKHTQRRSLGKKRTLYVP